MAHRDTLLTLAKAARRSGLSVPTLWRAVHAGELRDWRDRLDPITVSAAELDTYCSRRAKAARPKTRGWLTIYQAARLIGVAPSTVWRWMQQRRFRHRVIQGHSKVLAKQLSAFDRRRRAKRGY
jgi:predicted DNA-binding transcriptional regulator AlpA